MTPLCVSMIYKMIQDGRIGPDSISETENSLWNDWLAAKSKEQKALSAARAVGKLLPVPPPWALVACWLISEDEQLKVEKGTSDRNLIGLVLDHVALILLEEQEEHHDRLSHLRLSGEGPRSMTHAPFRGRLENAINRAKELVALVLGLREIGIENRTLRNRWRDEQERCSQAVVETLIEGFRNTERIRRVHKEWATYRENPDSVLPQHFGLAQLLKKSPQTYND